MRSRVWLMGMAMWVVAVAVTGAERKQGDVIKAQLGASALQPVVLEVVYIPPGEFMMGSTPEEKKWATGIEGGAQPNTERESYEGERPRRMRVADGFGMGRTEVTVGQFRRFEEATGTAG